MHTRHLSRSSRFSLFALVGLSLAGVAQAQTFSGSDDFNDNSLTVGAGERWRFDAVFAGSDTAFTEQNQRLEFTSTLATGTNARVLGWVSPSTSGGAYGFDWTATITVSNTTSPSAGYTLAGLEIYTLTDLGTVETPEITNNGYYAMYLNTSDSGANVLTEWGKYNTTTQDFDRTSVFAPTVDTTDVTFRAAFDAATKELTFDYSFDGVSFTTGATFDVDGAEAALGSPWMNGFGVELFGGSFNSAGSVASGQITFDNMSVSAIPEPSTYAALAGAGALGLVLWRRRRAVRRGTGQGSSDLR